jgi:hypothetical protein
LNLRGSDGEPPIVSTTCPFHSEPYLSGFPHVGVVDKRVSAPVPMLRRAIPGSPYFDGLGPWPYMSVAGPGDIPAIADAFSDLVTLTIIAQPGYRPSPERGNVVHLKHHFLFDPSLPFPALSKRTREHVRRGAKRTTVEIVDDFDARMELEHLYGLVKHRRGLGGLLDFPRVHFEALARMPGMMFFRARNAEATIGMTCGAVFQDRLQLLHIAASEAGLRDDASYVLMQGVVDFCRDRGLVLMMGGTPSRNGAGIGRFKARWSNREEPVFLVQIVNQPAAYAALCGTSPDATFFPAYRRPHS